MLVQKLQNIEKRDGVKKSKKANSGAGFSALISSSEEEGSNITPVSEISSPNTLISLQELEVNDKLNQEQNLSKSEETLNNLDKYQKNILNNEQNSVDISTLASSLKSRARSSNTKLEKIIDEIELRAAVEAAKKDR